jgi:hypothetical protein
MVSFCRHAAISAFAENSASCLGLGQIPSGRRIEEGHYVEREVWNPDSNRNDAQWPRRGLRRSEAMPINSKFPDLGFERLSGYA